MCKSDPYTLTMIPKPGDLVFLSVDNDYFSKKVSFLVSSSLSFRMNPDHPGARASRCSLFLVFTAHWFIQTRTDMKRIVTRPASFSLLLILFLASMLAFTACDSSTMVGPDDAPQDAVTMNNRMLNDPPGGGTTDPSDGHNTGCPAGDPEC